MPRLKDERFDRLFQLPDGGTSECSATVDLLPRKKDASGAMLLLLAPALSAFELPDGESIGYSLEESMRSDFLEPVVSPIGEQVGADDEGFPAIEVSVQLPDSPCRYLRVQATSTPGARPGSRRLASVSLWFDLKTADRRNPAAKPPEHA